MISAPFSTPKPMQGLTKKEAPFSTPKPRQGFTKKELGHSICYLRHILGYNLAHVSIFDTKTHPKTYQKKNWATQSAIWVTFWAIMTQLSLVEALLVAQWRNLGPPGDPPGGSMTPIESPRGPPGGSMAQFESPRGPPGGSMAQFGSSWWPAWW